MLHNQHSINQKPIKFSQYMQAHYCLYIYDTLPIAFIKRYNFNFQQYTDMWSLAQYENYCKLRIRDWSNV